MFIPKQKHRLLLLIGIAVIVFGLVATANAYMRPPNEAMDYAPQNFGIYDTYYCNFKESDCRSCHGTTTAWRHHSTILALTAQCTICHDIVHNPLTNPITDCKECHIDGTWVQYDAGYGVGNLGNPHHKSGLAAAGRCTGCHSSYYVSDPNTKPVPEFPPTNTTPTPFSCENCHWVTGTSSPDGPPQLSDWNLWVPDVGPKPTTWPDGLPHPAPIEANGLVTTGSVEAGDVPPTANKPFRPVSGTHHEIDGEIVTGHCVNCHATSPGSDYIIDPTDPLLIRGCENCHDIYTLHSELPGGHGIAEHITDGLGGLGAGAYTIGGVTNVYMPQNLKCWGCHGDDPIGVIPQAPISAPVIASVEPPMASAGVTLTLHAGSPDFGIHEPDDKVEMMGYGSSSLQTLPIVSWNPDKIEVVVPGATFDPGMGTIQVTKAGWAEVIGDGIGNDDGICDYGEACTQMTATSAVANFYLRQHPILNSVSPTSGTWGTTITINAQPYSFFSQREDIYDINGPPNSCDPGEVCYGYSTYVELVAMADKYRATSMSGSGWPGDSGLNPWSDTSIQINLQPITVGGQLVGNLLDVNTNNAVPLKDLYDGNWALYVVTDYFKYNTLGNTAPYLIHAGGNNPTGHLYSRINPDATLLYREVSDPLDWTATLTPYIWSLSQTSVAGGNMFAVYGVNFGIQQGTSYVKAAVANPDGSCPTTPSSYSHILPPSKIYAWANTRIIIIAPYVHTTACLQVEVPGVQPPGSTTSNTSAPITIY